MTPLKHTRGSSLVVTIMFLGIASITLAGVFSWANASARLAARNNEYLTTTCAAESAIERIRGELAYAYLNKGEPTVLLNLHNYSALVPNGNDDSYWTNYRFSDPTQPGQAATLVRKAETMAAYKMAAPYEGLTAYLSQYQVIANVVNTNGRYQTPVCVGAMVNLASLPLFQFAVFYQEDMEVNPGAAMTINGVVHGNADIYATSGAGLTFMDSVSASGNIHPTTDTKLGDSGSRGTNVVFKTNHVSNVAQQNLPIGTNQNFSVVSNTAANVHAVLDIPPVDEPYAYNQPGTNRYYNKADLVLKVTDSGVIALSGVWMGNVRRLTNFPSDTILKTAETFWDYREGYNMQATAVDIGALKRWSETNQELHVSLSTLYIADLRSTTNITTNIVSEFHTNPVVTPVATNLITTFTQPTSVSYSSVIITTNGTSPPAAAFNVVQDITNRTTTTFPSSYIPPVTTNTTVTTTSGTTKPSAPTYIGVVTTNRNGFGTIVNYTYNKITGYTYKQNLATYTYNLTRYSYTVTTYTTNNVKSTNFIPITVYTKMTEPAIVLTNGQILPVNGLTIATPDPVYIKGHYNVNTDGHSAVLGSADTSNTRPAAILSDAITILSSNWKNSASSNSLSGRVAADTTVNAAFLSGNTPTIGSYSGGLENFPRFLESWTGRTITYNGSMVVMFPSQIAKGLWGQASVYDAPKRNWSFDHNFLDKNKLPPNSPQVISVAHGQWILLSPGSTQF